MKYESAERAIAEDLAGRKIIFHLERIEFGRQVERIRPIAILLHFFARLRLRLPVVHTLSPYKETSNMDISTFKIAVRNEDHKSIAQGVRAYETKGLTEGAIYRLALAARPEMDRDTWHDLKTLSLEKNPA